MNILTFLVIFFCPALLVAFSPITKSLDLSGKFLLSCALSFPVVSGLFLLISMTDLTLGNRVSSIAVFGVISLVVVLFINWGEIRRSFSRVDVSYGLFAVLGLAIPIVLFTVAFILSEPLYFWSHNWLHADIIYSLMEDPFAPEDKQLAGLYRTYPWHMHTYFLVQSVALNMAPATSFTVINVSSLLVFLGFGTKIVQVIGGGRIAVLIAPFLFAFALNPVGALATRAALEWSPNLIAPWSFLFGDPRYDFLTIKFMWLNTHQLGLMLAAALAYVVLRPEGKQLKLHSCLMALITFALVVVYPLYLLVALVLVGSRGVALLLPLPNSKSATSLFDVAFLGVLLLIAAAVGYLLVTSSIAERVHGLGLRPSTPGEIWRNALQVGTATSLPGIAALLCLKSSYAAKPFQTIVLVLSAMGFGVLAIFLLIPNHKNEYKYVFMAGFALVPFLSIWIEKLLAKHAIRGAVFACAIAVICVTGAAVSLQGRVHSQLQKFIPPLEFDGLDQNLVASHPLAGPIYAIRSKTADDSILLAGDDELHLPTFTQRSLYVPYNPNRRHVGYLFSNEFVIENVKGTKPEIAIDRRNNLLAVMMGEDNQKRIEGLRSISQLEREIVILVNKSEHTGLQKWLDEIEFDLMIFDSDQYAVSVLPVGSLK